VAIVYTCGCGHVLVGETDEAVLADASKHVESEHPDLVGTLSPLELARPRGEREAA
jgi:hypothetical protein